MGNNPSLSKEDFLKFTHIVPNSEKPGYGSVHRHIKSKDGLKAFHLEDVKTLYHNWRRGVKNNAQGKCLGIRTQTNGNAGPYKWENYAAVHKKVTDFASGLVNLGLKKGDIVGVFSINRPEYVITEQGCYTQSMVIVSLYDTLGPDAVTFIINHCGLTTIVSSQDKIAGILKLRKECPTLKNIIQMEPTANKEHLELAEKEGVNLISFGEVLQNGQFKPHEDVVPGPDDLATIMYTSGTTGLPKGVLLKHSNVISCAAGAMDCGIEMFPTDTHISYLPMAHIFERIVQVAAFSGGAAVGFFQGSVVKLFDDIQALQPTIFPSVPRLFNRLFDKVTQTINQTGGLKKTLFDAAYASKKSQLDSGSIPWNPIYDKLIFEKMREKLGGKVRLIITGSAPISAEVHQFLKICFCCPVIQGYGLTETSAGSTITLMEDPFTGNVGLPLPCCEIRLQDVSEMNYFAKDNKGEVCIRGHNIFTGYYKDEEKTKESFDEDGYFHTGDVGQWNENGTLSIIDRKKNIFKLSQGEYVAAEFVESQYVKNKFVQQIFAYGDSLQSCLVGIVVPDPDVLKAYAKDNGIANADDFAKLCEDPKVKEIIYKDMTQTGKDNKLKGFEFVKSIYLESNPFSVENGLLTPSFKSMRNKLKDKYQHVIDQLYASLPKENPN